MSLSSNMSLGNISSFTVADRAGYSCYVRAAYCVTEDGVQKIVVTDRLGNHLNLGDSEVRSLKGAGIPNKTQVQLVIELIAAGKPMRMSDDVYTYLESSFRTSSYACRGTVFNPKVERLIRKPPPPIAHMTLEQAEKEPLIQEKQNLGGAISDAKAGWSTWLCCHGAK
ncbi:MAG: hypothetical protein CYPHOPRED_001007 [Cyphobasidiales sp. Tagirdzhanova-0007]|nr:MAG: hypothetical protein CYPHOPRED_001007 [Cyphobasidiales sp. Tagirdzhanova-0007]